MREKIAYLLVKRKNGFFAVTFIVLLFLIPFIDIPKVNGDLREIGPKESETREQYEMLDSIFHIDDNIVFEITPESTRVDSVIKGVLKLKKDVKHFFPGSRVVSAIDLSTALHPLKENSGSNIEKLLQEI